MDITECYRGLQSLVIFRNLLEDPTLSALYEYLQKVNDPERIDSAAESYAIFVNRLYMDGENLSRYLLRLVLEDENSYLTRYCASEEKKLPEVMDDCLAHELAFFEKLSRITPVALTGPIARGRYVPRFETEQISFAEEYQKHLAAIGERGYGMYARYHVFTVRDGAAVPVLYPDPQRLCELPGYEREREQIIANTEALLSGQPANNCLLYGDAGTGKSSTVKAIANEYRDRGLRLIEVKKNQLYQIPDLVDKLGKNPLKFILFVDDLSFSANDDNFSALKAILEGSVSGKIKNLVVYATSNRRHLIKESMADREGDDVHLADTMQELMSLSARFGLTVTFMKPDKNRYLTIVKELARFYEIPMDEKELEIKAEAHAIRHGGRSARTAKQFVEMLAGGVAG